MAAQASQQPRAYNNGYLPNGSTPVGVAPGAAPLLPNQGRVIENGKVRILCIADVRGNLKSLNELAKSAGADYILHTGDFGFYDDRSLERMAEKTLKHVVQYSPLISDDAKQRISNVQPSMNIKLQMQHEQVPLSQLPQFINKTFRFEVPVYTVWGACEDVQVLERLRSGEYKIDNLHIIDEANSRLLDVGGVKLRLLGLGGAIVMHKLFDNGEGRTTIAGGQGTMWTTLLQMGELVDTANRVFDPTEVRVLITHASPAREGILNQLSVALKADFSISAGLHFRYGSSYNEYSVNPSLDHYRGKLAASKASFSDVWETVRSLVEPAVQDNEAQMRLLQNALNVVDKMPATANGATPFGGPTGPATSGQVDETAFKNMWNFNLADAAFGWLVFEVESGQIRTEMKAQGFNFTRRANSNKAAQQQPQQQVQPPQSSSVPVSSGTPGPIAPSQQGQSQPRAAPNTQGAYPAARQNPQVRTQAAQANPQARPVQPTPPAATSPAPPQSAKSATPQPNRLTANATGTSEAQANGAAGPEDVISPKPSSPSVEKKPSVGLYITNVTSEDEAKAVIPEADRSKIQSVRVKGNSASIFFSSHDEMQAVLKNVSADLKGKSLPGKPHVRIHEDRTRGSFGPGTWQSSARGTPQQASGGYRSGGAASDSDTGRGGGRGTFRGRGRGDRGRGARGGRGGLKTGAEGSSPAPASPAAAAPSS